METPLTIRPVLKGTLVLRFADGCEQVLGDVSLQPDVEVSLDMIGTVDYVRRD